MLVSSIITRRSVFSFLSYLVALTECARGDRTSSTSTFRPVSHSIPASSSTVTVKVFNSVDTDHTQLQIPAATIILPILPGHENFDGDFYAFLVEHKDRKSGKLHRYMFDIGPRKDVLNLAPALSAAFASGQFQLNVTEDIPTQLVKGGIPLQSIDAVFWSHSHFDHIGDMSLWPNSTDLVIGEATDTRTYPTHENATLLDSDFAGRVVHKVPFANATLNFGGFRALDYFGDGSFYLLDVPGHNPGHMSALARVTPTSFILLAGDTYHTGAQIRPSPHLDANFPIPGDILRAANRNISREYFFAPDDNRNLQTRGTPFLGPTNGGFYFDPAIGRISQYRIGVFDSDPNILVLASHDPSFRELLNFFPEDLNQWKRRGWKNRGVWIFADPESKGYRLSAIV